MKKKIVSLITLLSILFAWSGCTMTTTQRVGASDAVPVLLDTDMGFDDWMSLLYLLNNPKVELKGISVDCTGETRCPEGAKNATKLLNLSGNASVPVFYGEVPERTLPWQFPKMIRDGATAMAVPGFKHLTGTNRYSNNAAELMNRMIYKAGNEGTPLIIISIGTATNISRAIEIARERGEDYFKTFRKGITMIYKGGGAVGVAEKGKLTNCDIPGNISIPEIFKSDNKTAGWNIYSDATSAQEVLISGLPVTLIPVNLSDQVPITEASYKKLQQQSDSQAAKFVLADIKVNVDAQGGWEKAELNYWDPSVVIAALNPAFVTEKYKDVSSCIDFKDGKFHGTVFVDSEQEGSTEKKCEAIGSCAGSMTVYTKIDISSFYYEFFSVLGKVPSHEKIATELNNILPAP